jgi:arylsulfatase A-like enzyme
LTAHRIVFPALPALLALAVVTVSACAKAPAGAERIVLIVVDTLRRDHVSAYGGEVLTPRIDALAERGQVFSHVRAAFHQTTMSMGSLFTGRTPSLELAGATRSLPWNGETWCGMARFASGDDATSCLPDALPTLGETMKRAGYWTIGIPSNQFLFGDSGFSQGFDDWIEVGAPDSPSSVVPAERRRLSELRASPNVLAAVNQALARRESDHFFLYVHFMDVHDYHYAKTDYRKTVGVLDAAIGRLLDMLEAEGLLAGATVLLTSDHGERLGEVHRPRGRPGHYGNPAFEELLAIPLIAAPAVVDDPTAPLRTQDLHPLLARIAGLPAQDEEVLGDREHYVSERAFRTYVDGHFKSTLRRRDGKLFLFDLASDPDETRDASSDLPEIADAHRRRIDELANTLAVDVARSDRELSEEERRTLEALGYIE